MKKNIKTFVIAMVLSVVFLRYGYSIKDLSASNAINRENVALLGENNKCQNDSDISSQVAPNPILFPGCGGFL